MLVHRGVVLVLVHGVFAAPHLGGDLALDVERQAAVVHVLVRVDHRVAVEHHVQQRAHLRLALKRMVHGPAAVVDQARRGGVEPLHVVPALAPYDGAVRHVGHLVVVLGDVAQQLRHDRRIVALEGVPVEHRVLLGGQHALEDAGGDAMRDVAVDLRVVAPQAEVVNRRADDLIPHERTLGARLHGGPIAQDGAHVVGEGEVGHAGVARHLVAAVVLDGLHAHVGVAVDRAAVAAVHLDGVLRRLDALVLERLHAAVAHGVELAWLRLARFDGAALGVLPGQALLRRPARALVVVLGPLLLG